jgi:hypothetical protein
MLMAALALLLVASPAPAWPHADALFGAREEVLRRAFIPSGPTPHGELVVLRRGNAVVVRTTLVSALLGRGLQSMRRQEQARWPEGSEGRADSVEYLKALEAAEDRARDEYLARRNQNDERRKMMIELVQDETTSFFAVYAIDARQAAGGFEVLAARPVLVRDASRAYVAGAMRTQCAKGLHLAGADLEALLAPR